MEQSNNWWQFLTMNFLNVQVAAEFLIGSPDEFLSEMGGK